MQILARMILESSYDFMRILLIHMDAEIIIMSCQGFSEKNILSLLSDKLRQIFDDLCQARILGGGGLGSSTTYNTTSILWYVLHIHEVMAEFSKHNIKRQTSITSIFVRFLITAKIYDTLQKIPYMKRDIKVLRNKSYHCHGRFTKLEE